MNRLSFGRRSLAAALALATLGSVAPANTSAAAAGVGAQQGASKKAAPNLMSRFVSSLSRFFSRNDIPLERGGAPKQGPPSRTGGIPWPGRPAARARRNGGYMA